MCVCPQVLISFFMNVSVNRMDPIAGLCKSASACSVRHHLSSLFVFACVLLVLSNSTSAHLQVCFLFCFFLASLCLCLFLGLGVKTDINTSRTLHPITRPEGKRANHGLAFLGEEQP